MKKLTHESLREVLAEKGAEGLRNFLVQEQIHPSDIALMIEDLSEEEKLLVYRLLPKDVAAEAFSQMNPARRADLFDGLDRLEEQELLDRLDTDDAVDLLEELPANMVRRLLQTTNPSRRKILNRFLHYAPESAGSVMTDIPLTFYAEQTVGEALHALREDRTGAVTFGTLYVTSVDRILLGVLSLRELLQAEDHLKLAEVMHEKVISVHTNVDRQEAVGKISHYDFTALPVTDSENRLVGVITVDDAMDIQELEASEDMELFAGVQPRETGYREQTAWEHARGRLPWMFVLMISGLFNGAILGNFESAFLAYPVLVTFIPMLTDTGGNAGSQSSTLIIRGLATHNLDQHDLGRVLWKEFRTSIYVGIPLLFTVILRCWIMAPGDLLIGIVTGLAMLAIVTLSKLLGALLPMFSVRVGLDPALMSGPLITTAVDAAGLLIYFGLAKLLLRI